jgi:ribosomal protein S12 methylthiotransferase accessory factor
MAAIDGLDRIGIPVYSAIAPRSEDLVSVYNGKGPTALDAKVGAAMESIERWAAWSTRRPDLLAAYSELSSLHSLLHPSELVIDLAPQYTDERAIPWITGFELVSRRHLFVPFAAAAYFQDHGQFGAPCYALTSTNGLAAGNTIEEAVCHALCEVIERDAVTMAELLSRGLPSLLRTSDSILSGDRSADDLERFPTVSLDSLQGTARLLLDRYSAAQLRPVIRNVTADNGIPTITCTITEDLHPSFSRAHTGVGSHPDAEVAIIRSLTEAAQVRASDIHGLREDISMADEDVPRSAVHAQRVARIDTRGWYHRESSHPIDFSEIPTHRHEDVLQDIELMVSRLSASGLDRVIVVDLSPEGLEVAVARVLVPGLETWAALKGRVGTRAESAVRSAVRDERIAEAARENARRMGDVFGGVPRP